MKNIKFILAITAIIVLFGNSVIAQAGEPEKGDVPECKDWSFNSSFEWCFNFGGKTTTKAAGSRAWSAALGFISKFPVIGEMLKDPSDGGPSELDIAVERILGAIQVTENNILDALNQLVISRDFASLEAFKLQVGSYMLTSEAVKRNNINQLQNLWNTSIELRNYFQTHTDQIGIIDALSSYHSYLGIVSLELVLRTQLTIFNYQLSGEEYLIDDAIKEHFKLELAGVIGYIDKIQWSAAAQNAIGFERTSIWANTVYWRGLVGSCPGLDGYHNVSYLNNIYNFSAICSMTTGKCAGKVNRDYDDLVLFEKGSYFKDKQFLFHQNAPAPDSSLGGMEYGFSSSIESCNFAKLPETYLNEGDLHPQNIYAGMVKSVEEAVIMEAYRPTQLLLDSWWALAGYTTPRPRNYADTVVASRPDYFQEEDAARLSLDFEDEVVWWQNLGEFEWVVRSSATPSGGTGPTSFDGSYAYLETSANYANSAGDEAILVSSPFAPNASHKLRFDYHMYGSDIGSLSVEVLVSGETQIWQPIWYRNGQQHSSGSNSWSEAVIDLTDFANKFIQLRIRSVARGGYKGDIAIDDIKLDNKLKIYDARWWDSNWFYMEWEIYNGATDYQQFVVGYPNNGGPRKWISRFSSGGTGRGNYVYEYYHKNEICAAFGSGTFAVDGEVWAGSDFSTSTVKRNVGNVTCP